MVTEDQPAANDLTKFQTRILEILAVKPLYGLAIKRRLQTYYQEEVNHGRLYPNLDELIENGLVEKSELDKRTNEYALTDLGRRVVEFEANWAQQRLEGEDVETAGDVR
ncbi:PadR family transcriptional regulator [Halobiforma nitratireducens]|uniref:PadR family transcriptional regulator n=1 Tax=Halobiforma nitratireducens TaxID=130048 RepID=UPI000677D641|nr:PadR family transcriptional regulator [Halobiforma nitratireducens]